MSSLDSTSLYKLIVGQLADDGLHGAAQSVAAATCTAQGTLPCRALQTLLSGEKPDLLLSPIGARMGAQSVYRPGLVESVGSMRAVTQFSHDGRNLAVGTNQGTVYILDAEALLQGKSSAESAIKRYNDHKGVINDLDFHPTGSVIVSASEDSSLNFYDTADARQQPVRVLNDTHPVRSAAFHPKGDHLLVGTTHQALHIYDVATFRCFLSPGIPETTHHQSAITDAQWAADGSCFASCAAAELKIWDGGSCRCVATLSRPHGGAPIGGLRFCKGAPYMLSCGADSAVKLWDLRAMREAGWGSSGATPVRMYEGSTQTSARRVIGFTHDEALVMSADQLTASVVLWSTSSGEVVGRCFGHTAPVHCISHAPNSSAFVSTGEDGMLRAWSSVPG